MAKLTLNDLSSLENQTSAIALINANNTLVEAALENTLSLDGTAPNAMEADLDMNSNRIYNLPEPQTGTEPLRLTDFQNAIENGEILVGLDGLSDVTLTAPADDEFLRYNGSLWVNEAVSLSTLSAAPSTADYIVKTADSGLSGERVATDNTSVTWDFGTSGQAKLSRAALTGDVTASANANATTITNDAVTYAKMQNVSAVSQLLGRGSAAGSGDVQEIALGSGLSMSGTTLSATAGAGLAPDDVDYIVKTASGSLSAERVATDNTSITWDFGTAAQAKLSRAALTGDVTASANGNATTIANDAVTYAKMQNVSATSRVLGRITSGSGDVEELTGANVTTIAALTDAIEFVIDGGGSAISTGVKGYIECPFACTITRATALADTSGSIVVDVWKDTYANYPPIDADSITASAPVTIATATKSQDSTLTGWTTSIAAGDVLGFNVDSATTITRVTVSLKVTRTGQ